MAPAQLEPHTMMEVDSIGAIASKGPRTDAAPSPPRRRELEAQLPASCVICWKSTKSSGSVTLACHHGMCAECARKMAALGQSQCPLCHSSHVLNLDVLRRKVAEWRNAYRSWRMGSGRGAAGDISDVVLPHSQPILLWTRTGLHHPKAGDLATPTPTLEDAPLEAGGGADGARLSELSAYSAFDGGTELEPSAKRKCTGRSSATELRKIERLGRVFWWSSESCLGPLAGLERLSTFSLPDDSSLHGLEFEDAAPSMELSAEEERNHVFSTPLSLCYPSPPEVILFVADVRTPALIFRISACVDHQLLTFADRASQLRSMQKIERDAGRIRGEFALQTQLDQLEDARRRLEAVKRLVKYRARLTRKAEQLRLAVALDPIKGLFFAMCMHQLKKYTTRDGEDGSFIYVSDLLNLRKTSTSPAPTWTRGIGGHLLNALQHAATPGRHYPIVLQPLSCGGEVQESLLRHYMGLGFQACTNDTTFADCESLAETVDLRSSLYRPAPTCAGNQLAVSPKF